MSINQLILRSLKKNLKNYYLYVFALMFSVVLYFGFVTLQYDPAMDPTKGSIKGAAAIRAASVLLVAIVAIFLLYANNIFIKRRSKEIGLFQLIGMTKNKIFQILSIENFVLYFGSVIIGIFLGFSVSKLIIMILYKTTGINAIATLHFSLQALIQTLVVFIIIYIFIMMMNYLFIKRQTILSLFHVHSSSEGKVKKISTLEMVLGTFGIILTCTGYYISSKLFGGSFTTINELFLAMIIILTSVIIGTYFFYKGSVSFITNLIRKKKNGYLTVNEILSLSSIMFRMKSNALLLTIITTVSALAIGLLSLSYISYYSAEKTAKNLVAADFSVANIEDSEQFKEVLSMNDIEYSERIIDVIQVDVNIEDISKSKLQALNFDPNMTTMSVISDSAVEEVDLSSEEAIFSGYNDMLQKFLPMKDAGEIKLIGRSEVISQKYLGLRKDFLISLYFTNGGLPVVIVDESVFNRLKNDLNPVLQKQSSVYIGIDILDQATLEKANALFSEVNFEDRYKLSRLDLSNDQKKTMGLAMFIVGFLGLAFLITSGCILYFKQMDESEDEKSNYTILRKLGFTQTDLLKGIQAKQLYSFGIPLSIGLLHSFFAVQSGWFLFGAEVWTPMLIVMILYTGLYSIFGMLSVLYYKTVIRESL